MPGFINGMLWMTYEWTWKALFRGAINEQRELLDLPPINKVQAHIFTDRPWLAADASLAPAGSSDDLQITQTGPWLLNDPAPLPVELEKFLADGEPPVYFGFGSMSSTALAGEDLLEAARASGHRAIISRGWANLELTNGGDDCISIGDVNHARLLPRTAAIVHHGGAGTTTAAALAGKPQIILPQLYDQFYWAHRVKRMGIGVACRPGDVITIDGLANSLRECLKPAVIERGISLKVGMELNGARNSAEKLAREINA
jgi:vancomycin aglycone glucosyltransferase